MGGSLSRWKRLSNPPYSPFVKRGKCFSSLWQREAGRDFKKFIRYARKPQVSNLGMNGILSERSQVEPGEAEQIGT